MMMPITCTLISLLPWWVSLGLTCSHIATQNHW
jgi:hypothetical protein